MGDQESRITELEIRVALQEDLLAALNDTVAKLQDTLDLQQAQTAESAQPYSLADEVPPHY